MIDSRQVSKVTHQVVFPALLRQAVFLALLLLVFTGSPASAHHSISAEFDQGKTFTVTGVLTQIEWTNPHIYTFVDVKDPTTGKVETWSFEGNPPGNLHRSGLRKEDWKIGETVTVTALAAKDGTKRLGFAKEIAYQDGHTLSFRINGQ